MATSYPGETLDLIRLAMLPGLGPRTLAALLEHFGSAERVLSAPREQLALVPRVGPKLIASIRHADAHVDVDGIVDWCGEHGVRIITMTDEDYPASFESLPDAPPVMFVRGQLSASDSLAIGIVGTRHATQYGLREAARFARDLARAGVTVVSGMARGIDAAAHRGAIEAGGRTIAVLGGGLAHIYPPEHKGLSGEIAAAGAVISEYAPDAPPRGPMFPQRNRLISGLSLGVLVIEAAARSGSLITARHAAEQGREVFALPGPVTSRVSLGCHALIRDGAHLVTSVDHILEELGPAASSIPTGDGHQLRQPGELLLNDQERTVLEVIATEATSIDVITRQSGLPIHRVLSTISVLETRRLIRRLSGQFVSRI